MKIVDIIVPCYNEQEVLTAFFTETEKIVNTIEGYKFRYIFVNDGSKDDTLKILKSLRAENPQVEYISFSRNFGKEAGMYAGLSNSTGDYAIIMDADLQHPPALIPRMIESVENGHDCCAAYRIQRKGGFFSKAFFKLNNALTNIKLPYGAVDYRIMSHQMIKSIVSLCEIQRFSKGIFSWVGFDTEWIPYKDVQRTMGTTKWSFGSLVRYACDGIFSFSVSPLRLLTGTGFFISAVALIYAVFILVKTLIVGVDAPGYASTIIILLFLGGIIELSIGILGTYISRIYTETKHRPIYIAKENTLDVNEGKGATVNEKSN